ncbi:polyketide synthase [Chloroflexi bacterium TSY]|nr:polyketide synthase [Chloroflexi bacterium TSY]
MTFTNGETYPPPTEPIAIVGMGCRLPGGANSPESFWHLLRDEVDTITEIPADRWSIQKFFDPDQSKPGQTHIKWGGFIDEFDRFDANFFGISPREAAAMDPQQRILLETTWEALEDGGQVPEQLAGSATGVFVGIFMRDWEQLHCDSFNRALINGHTGTGSSMSIAANRISYIFDFRGPSIALDTACSSSLIAVHLACQSLHNGECALAVAGGINLLFGPEKTIATSKASMLSPDGRCKSFDVRANGYVRSEGCGMVVLKPLNAALADGDSIYAIIRGSASNQDGRSQGLTVPNGQAQEAALHASLQQANLRPQDIQYVEAHGTGTHVGDPIETRALGNVIGRERRDTLPHRFGEKQYWSSGSRGWYCGPNQNSSGLKTWSDTSKPAF